MMKCSISSLLLAFSLLSPSLAATAAPDDSYPKKYLQVHHGKEGKKLRIPIATYQNEAGKTVDLVGVIHVADPEYYKLLNKRFDSYDRVLFEMVNGEDLVRFEILKKKMQKEGLKGAELDEYQGMLESYVADSSALSSILKLVMEVLKSNTGLVIQQEGIDYAKTHFVYADMTQKELSAAMDARGETMLGILLCDALLGRKEKPKANLSYGELLRRLEATGAERQALLRDFLIEALVHTTQRDRVNENAIIVSRNEKAMQVFDEVMRDEKLKNVAIFYGAAHLPDFHKRMLKRGYKLTKVEWLPSFSTEM